MSETKTESPLKCPGCGCGYHRTLETRACTIRDRDTGVRKPAIRRRRECRHCGRRFTTHEAAAKGSAF